MVEKYVLKHRKDSEPIQVLKYTGCNYDEVMEFIGDSWGEIKYVPKEWYVGFEDNVLDFKDETGSMFCYAGDYIINDNNNVHCLQKFYPCRKHLFEPYYEPYDKSSI